MPAGRQTREDGVDEVAEEALVQWCVAVEKPMVERPVEQVECEFDVGGGRQLAALDRVPEDRPGLGATRLDEAIAVLPGEGRVGLRLGDERCDHASVRSFADQPYPGAQE